MPAQSRRSRSSTANSRFYLRVDAPHRLDWNTFPSFVRFAGPHHPYNSPPLLFLERVYIPAAATVPGPVFVARRFRQRFCVIVAAHLFFLSVGLTNSRILFAFRVCPFFFFALSIQLLSFFLEFFDLSGTFYSASILDDIYDHDFCDGQREISFFGVQDRIRMFAEDFWRDVERSFRRSWFPLMLNCV